MHRKELVIIGAGTAGLHAALAAHKRKCRDILVLEQEPSVSISWPKLPGLTLKTEATALSLNERKQVTFTGPHIGYQQLQAEAIILATGAIPVRSDHSTSYRPDVQLCHSASITLSPGSYGPCVNEMSETSLHGVFACGDALFVHDISFSVQAESSQTGMAAARYLKEGFFRHPVFSVEISGLLTYVIPSTICPMNISETLTFTLCAAAPGTQLRIFRDNMIWKELPWPSRQGQQHVTFCIHKEALLSIRYRLHFELK